MPAGNDGTTGHPVGKLSSTPSRDTRQASAQLFADDLNRGERMRAEAVGIYLDYSKNRITEETLRLLFDLAEAVDLRANRAMFRGDKINVSEGRAVLHTALRARRAPRSWSTVRMWCLRCTPCSTGWPGSRTASERCLEGTPAPHSQCRQHRHWRFRPRAGDGA